MNLNSIIIPPTPKSYPQGNNIALQIGTDLTISYWDLWCLICADEEFGGSLNTLKDHLIQKRKNGRFNSFSTTNHLEDTITHLEELEPKVAHLPPIKELLTALPLSFYRKERQKAARNIIEGSGGYPRSEAMLRSPRRLLEREAMRGQWKRLPIDPTPIEERLRPLFLPKKDGFYTESASFPLSRRLDRAIAKELKVSDPHRNFEAHQYAVYRAALTLYQEENCWDDSYGNMGMLGQEWVKAILCLTPDRCRSFPEPFLKDLIMYSAWEEYGLVDFDTVGEYLRNLSNEEQDLSRFILSDLIKRSTQAFQEYKSSAAQSILKRLNA